LNIAKKIAQINNEHGSLRPLNFLVVCLKNSTNNDMILKNLKQQYHDILCNDLEIDTQHDCWIDYPSGFNQKALATIIRTRIEAMGSIDSFDLLIDVSNMPRFFIFSLCEVLSEAILHNYNINRIDFGYTSPEYYPSLHYAQDIGMLCGLFSGMPLLNSGKKMVKSIIFPSRSGHEGKLLLDELSQTTYEESHVIFFPINTLDYLSSLDLLRANQLLLERESFEKKYYCTLSDAVIELEAFLAEEEKKMQREANSQRQSYLVAPFGPKVILPISYFLLKNMKDNYRNMDIEICHARGFQYTTVYSIGVGELFIVGFDVTRSNDQILR